MAEFDEGSIRRISDAIRWVERFIAQNKNQSVPPPILQFELIEDVDPAEDFVKADIYYMTSEISIADEVELHYRGSALYGQKTGYTGDCHLFENKFWALGVQIERLERFTMASNWSGGLATAQFKLAESTTFDEAGVIEDPEGFFTHMTTGSEGLAIRTINNRHFVIHSMVSCTETLYKFQMLSNWSGTTASAKFWVAGESVATGGVVGTIRDELSIFPTVLSFGKWGLAIRNCAGQFFVIQAPCQQVTLGSCVYSGGSGPTCDITTEDACDALSGVWTEGVPCP